MKMEAYVNGKLVNFEKLKEYTIKNEIIDKTISQVINRQNLIKERTDVS